MFTNPKKKYFKQKLDAVQKSIWDFEFKLFKTREIREDVRKVYDGAKASLFSIEQQLAAAPDEERRKQLEDQKVLAERDIQRYEAQMMQLDIEISGAKPSPEMPDGFNGITNQLDSLQELKVMVTEYTKTL